MVDSGKLGLFTIAGFSIVLCQVLSLFWITCWNKESGIGGLILSSYVCSHYFDASLKKENLDHMYKPMNHTFSGDSRGWKADFKLFNQRVQWRPLPSATDHAGHPC